MPTCTYYQPPAPLPIITLTAHAGRLIGLDWWDNKTAKLLNFSGGECVSISANTLSASDADQALLLRTISELDGYFYGALTKFSIPLDLSVGTQFQQCTWQALRTIAYGRTVSYARLAMMIDEPFAYRACANANGKNPISLIIPCHRVIASDGGLGGYTGGTDIKRWLLAHERKYEQV